MTTNNQLTKLISSLSELSTESVKDQYSAIRDIGYLLLDLGANYNEVSDLITIFKTKYEVKADRYKEYAAKRDYSKTKRKDKRKDKLNCFPCRVDNFCCSQCKQGSELGFPVFSFNNVYYCCGCAQLIYGEEATKNHYYKIIMKKVANKPMNDWQRIVEK